jgi:glycosyltransferase involved in cell wall biosynthesis
MGAVRLIESLLPALERAANGRLGNVWLPAGGPIATYGGARDTGPYHHYRRFIPNAVSRLLECTLLSRRLGGGRVVLTLGNLPLRTALRQVVFVHTPFLLSVARSPSFVQNVKSAINRWVFSANLPAVDAAIVQTETMRSALIATFPGLAGKVHVVRQPSPEWLLTTPPRVRRTPGEKLRLFYPAAGYAHKNHELLGELTRLLTDADPLERIDVTIEPAGRPVGPPWLRYLGPLAPVQVIEEYAECDALVFPSLEESYGLPLIEAMHLGLPIVAADLPYARELCGDQAIYFDPRSATALRAAIGTLAARLATGWRPDWASQLAHIPRDWEAVARLMLSVIDSVAPARTSSTA